MREYLQSEKATDMERLAILKEAIMDKNRETWKDPLLFIKEIESRINDLVSARREQIEKELEDRIEKEKREAEKKIESFSSEFEKNKTALLAHKDQLARLQTSRDELYERIKSHLKEASARREIAGAALEQAAEELNTITELKQELFAIKDQAEKEIGSLKAQLDQVGLDSDLPGLFEIEDPAPEYETELLAIRNFLDMMNGEKSGPAGENAEQSTAATVAAPADEAIEGLEDQVPSEPLAPEEPEENAGSSPEPEEPEIQEDPGPLLEALRSYERTEPAGNGVVLTFYEGPQAKIIDLVSLMEAMDKVSQESAELHEQLARTTSIKDLFLTKQEILNKQEILRKAFYMAVKYCEKEGGELPVYVIDIFNIDKMKDALERLTLGNWSDLTDFEVFNSEATGIFNDLRIRLKSFSSYLRSIMDQVRT